jgi:hypothetical protein
VDQFYFESGYIDDRYFVYIADAKIDLRHYIEEGYLDPDYFVYYGISSSLTGSLDLVVGEIKEFEGAFTATATVTATAFKIVTFSADFGSLFTPSMTVNAIKRPTVFIETAVTQTATAVVNRSTNIAIDSLANVNAQSDVFRGYQSSLTATASATAAAGKITPNSALLESQTTQSTTAITVELAQASLAATATFTATAFIANQRPRQYELTGAVIDTSIKKFGAGSARLGEGNFFTIPASLDWTTWRTVDLWFYLPTVSGSQNSEIINTDHIRLNIARVGPPDGINVSFSAPGGKVVFFNTVAGLRNQWVHLRLVRGGAAPYFHLWLNGTKVSVNFSDTVNDSVGTTATTWVMGQFPGISNRDFYLDELLITDDQLTDPSTSTFTPPTSKWLPTTQSNIYVLSHYDTDFSDDLGILQLAGSTQSTTTALTATATAVKDINSTLTSAATLSAQAIKTAVTDSTLTAETAVTATATKTVVADSTQAADTTQTTTAVKTATATINAGSLFTPAVTAQAILRPDVFLETASTVTATAQKTTDAISTGTASAAVTATAQKTTDVISTQSAVITLTAQADRTVDIDSSLNAVVALSAQATRTRDIDSALTTQATVTVDVSSFTEAVIDEMATFCTVTVTAQKTTDVDTEITAVTTVTAQAQRTRLADTAVTATATFAATATRTRPGSSTQNTVATVAITAQKTTDITVTALAEAAVTASVNYTVSAQTQFASIAITITAAVKNTNNEVIVQTSAALSAAAGRIIEYRKDHLSGARSSVSPTYHPRLLITNAPFFNFGPRQSGFCASIWMKLDSIEDRQTIWSDSGTWPGGVALVIDRRIYPNPGTPNPPDNPRIALRFRFDEDEPIPIWEGATTDTDWHHYLLWAPTYTKPGTSVPAGNWFRLWVDGVEKTAINNTHQASYSPSFSNGTYVRFGTAQQTPDIDNPYTLESWQTSAGYAQIWMGSTNAGNFSPTEFYNDGFVDLGPTGRGLQNRLSTPWVYDLLSTPFSSDISFDPAAPTASAEISTEPLARPLGQAQTRFTVTAVGVTTVALNAAVTSTLTAQATTVLAGSATVTVTTALEISATISAGLAAEFTEQFQFTAQVERSRSTGADLTAASALSVISGFEVEYSAALTVTSTVSADVTLIPPIRTTADLTAETDLDVDISVSTDVIIVINSLGTLIADATLIPPIRGQADLTSTATVTAEATTQISGQAALTAAATVTTDIKKFTGIIETLPAAATLSATPFKFTGIAATILEAMMFQITLGDVINLAPELTLKILPESRLLEITQETRDLNILQETRVNIIDRG